MTLKSKKSFHFQHYDKCKVFWLSHSDIPLWQLLGGLRSLSVLGDMSKHTLDSIAISVFEEVSIGWFGQILCQYQKPLQLGGLSVRWYERINLRQHRRLSIWRSKYWSRWTNTVHSIRSAIGDLRSSSVRWDMSEDAGLWREGVDLLRFLFQFCLLITMSIIYKYRHTCYCF